MSAVLAAYVDGVGLLGPGFDSWEQACPILAGKTSAVAVRTRLPVPETLPPAERRRAGMAVKAALAAGLQAIRNADVSAQDLATVFTSSGGDGVNCHEICAALATADRMISPTRFHNSVHNAPAGYWSISSGAMATSSVLCAYDGSFTAGLLEALAQVASGQRPVLLVAYDTDYPHPLHAVRPIPDTMGVGLLLSPQAGSRSIGRIAVDSGAAFTERPGQAMADPVLEGLRASIPAARCLPLLRVLALARPESVDLDYLHDMRCTVQVMPC
ncbi:MAG: beta-ketoacyl synthase chain length factor [Ramlibacter sp.]